METLYVTYGAIILCSIGSLTLAKPFEDEKSFSDDNNEGIEYEKPNQNSFSDYYKPRVRFEGSDKFPNRVYGYDKKRSTIDEITDNLASSSLQKRQVGVVYRDDKPIGILQPYQRSYRFIPVKEENDLYTFSASQIQDLPVVTDVDKREINGINLDPAQLDETYPSILTNFKIDNKLDKKRNYDAFTDDNVRDLKATIRRLRSSNPHNNEQIEEELKNILDDMGLIEDEEVHGEKREVVDDQMDDENEPASLEEETKFEKERNKRDETCIRNENADANGKPLSEHTFLNSDEKRNEIKNDPFGNPLNKRETVKEAHRMKRQKQEIATTMNKENSELVENLKDSGDLMISGNKSPLASSSEITVRDTEKQQLEKRGYDEDNEDYDNRVEKQIQSKINSLKEEVKREIEALKKNQNDDDDDDDIQRKKRQATDNLINEETDELNPALNPDSELKPLIRKRRHLNASVSKHHTNATNVRKKRETNFFVTGRKKRRSDRSPDSRSREDNYKSHQKENDEGGELLGGDDFDDGGVYKRQIYDKEQEYANLNIDDSKLNKYLRDERKRSGIPSNEPNSYDNYGYHNFFYDNNNNARLKRQNFRDNFFKNNVVRQRYAPFSSNQWKSRFRRRISEDQVLSNRPQQLSDMSELDLFGALPKSYDGELSRYKRVKRK
ncbi:uncharacterized protein DDB_G0283697-like isoform X2 [Zophobas morio]|uniref:uncharacterized protein DDB_G0283697-like isoform X2 n=1 Tax=Zophobas morio TaxID=2755281 RepID=UPI0030827574